MGERVACVLQNGTCGAHRSDGTMVDLLQIAEHLPTTVHKVLKVALRMHVFLVCAHVVSQGPNTVAH
jgi:hypothetical protein